jgi:drug/metabolite transporter (DMT)-like permease
MAIILGIGAAIGFGVVDFIGGVQSRRHSVPIVVAISQGTGFTLLGVVLIVSGQPLPPLGAAILGFLSGMALLLGVTAYYRGLSIGAMGVVGPIAATAVMIPLAVGLISGDDLSSLQAAGIALAVGGMIATGYQPTASLRGGKLARGVGAAMLAAIGIGIYYPLVDLAANNATVLWVVFLHRLGAVTTIATFVYPYLARGPMRRREHGREHFGKFDAGSLIGMGVISVISTGLFAAATTEGLLAVVSVLAAMFPVTTILLARVFLGERLSVPQRVGAVAALAGVALIAS